MRMNNSTRARLGWAFSFIYCIFVHPDLDSVPLFVGMPREWSIVFAQPQRARNSCSTILVNSYRSLLTPGFLDKSSSNFLIYSENIQNILALKFIFFVFCTQTVANSSLSRLCMTR